MPEKRTILERRAMHLALELARSGQGSGTNPSVGAVVLAPDGTVLGRGRTQPPAPVGSGAHAEVVALAEAGELARGATVVSTLEPCNATGRTGPCTAALIAAGVARVVYGINDPHPTFAGGAATLEATGITVIGHVLGRDAAETHLPWTTAIGRGWPFVTLKLASTYDGRAAAADGTSRWITGAGARADVHALRGRVDAVMVGSGTVLSDDPALTVRGTPEGRHPLRVVLDSRGRVPVGAKVRDASAPTVVLTGGHDLPDTLATLYSDYDVRHLLVEGGPTLAGALLAAGLVDETVSYFAPSWLGAGVPTVATDAFPTIDAAVRFTLVDVAVFGDDVRLTARPAENGGS